MKRFLGVTAAALISCQPAQTKQAADTAQTALVTAQPVADTSSVVVSQPSPAPVAPVSNQSAANSKASTTTKPPATPQNSVTPAPSTTDTLRGTFVLQGVDPMPMAVLRTASGRFFLDGTTRQMQKLSHLELWVAGHRISANRFHVIDYQVRAANGTKAWDGILKNGAAGFNLQLANGSSHAIRGAPGNFAQLLGQRMWVTENPDGSLKEYGAF